MPEDEITSNFELATQYLQESYCEDDVDNNFVCWCIQYCHSKIT